MSGKTEGLNLYPASCLEYPPSRLPHNLSTFSCPAVLEAAEHGKKRQKSKDPAAENEMQHLFPIRSATSQDMID